jgi:hypothetical protein
VEYLEKAFSWVHNACGKAKNKVLVPSVAIAAAVAAAVSSIRTTFAILEAAAPTAAAAARRALICFIHNDSAACKGRIVESAHCSAGILVVAHLDKAKASASSSVTIKNDVCGNYLSVCCEKVIQLVVVSLIGQPTYIKFHFASDSMIDAEKICCP